MNYAGTQAWRRRWLKPNIRLQLEHAVAKRVPASDLRALWVSLAQEPVDPAHAVPRAVQLWGLLTDPVVLEAMCADCMPHAAWPERKLMCAELLRSALPPERELARLRANDGRHDAVWALQRAAESCPPFNSL